MKIYLLPEGESPDVGEGRYWVSATIDGRELIFSLDMETSVQDCGKISLFARSLKIAADEHVRNPDGRVLQHGAVTAIDNVANTVTVLVGSGDDLRSIRKGMVVDLIRQGHYDHVKRRLKILTTHE